MFLSSGSRWKSSGTEPRGNYKVLPMCLVFLFTVSKFQGRFDGTKSFHDGLVFVHDSCNLSKAAAVCGWFVAGCSIVDPTTALFVGLVDFVKE